MVNEHYHEIAIIRPLVHNLKDTVYSEGEDEKNRTQIKQLEMLYRKTARKMRESIRRMDRARNYLNDYCILLLFHSKH